MLKKLTLRLRLTILNIVLLTVCCVGLTMILNFSASHMADVIEAVPLVPTSEVSADRTSVSLKQQPAETAASVPISETSAARNRFFRDSIFYMILIVTVGGGITYWLCRRALSPLRDLSRQIKNKTVHNLSEELPVSEIQDETTELALSFNEMTSRLNEAFAMQRRFAQNAAHELRTPLTVLKTKVDVFQKREAHIPQDYTKLLSVITTYTDRLADLVKDLLNLTNMDSLSCHETVPLLPIFTDIVKELSGHCLEKNIKISIHGDEQTVSGNQTLLYRAFYNLIENAIRYNRDNGTVNISIVKSGEKSRITIQDTGIGIPCELKDLIFEPFFRVDKSRSRQMGGAGLGLSLVKSIIEKHDGQILVLDPPIGGSIFEILLP